jgi:hypothetical protein
LRENVILIHSRENYPTLSSKNHYGQPNHHHEQERTFNNIIEDFWPQMKRSTDGTYHTVSEKHLQKYVDEFAYRSSVSSLFLQMLFAVVRKPYEEGQKTFFVQIPVA